LAQDITERKRAEEKLQNLSRQLLVAQETERLSIARELHDQIGQAITAVTLNLRSVKRVSPAPALDEALTTLDRVLEQIRDLSFDLRPLMLDHLGLVAAVRSYLDRQARRAGFQAEVVAKGLNGRLSPDLEITCYRIVQEGVTNVVRHARAKHVHVELRRSNGDLELVIRDDGAGFDPPSVRKRGASLGLVGIEERVSSLGGQFEIDSAPGRGTEIRACFPLQSA
jgi:signal transduction histidine kinase